MSNDSLRLRHLNTWSPTGGAACEGCGTPRSLGGGSISLETGFEDLRAQLTSCSLSQLPALAACHNTSQS